MRRAIAAAVTSGLVLGGALATPAFAADHGPGKAAGQARQAAPAKHSAGRPATAKAPAKAATTKAAQTKAAQTKGAQTKAAKPATKTVVFAGYEFDVPATWPVYRVDEHPQTCVRYDVHAVYLGVPGLDMNCPAGLVGRTEAVDVVPGTTAAAGSDAGSASLPNGAGGHALQPLSAVHATIEQGAVDNELQVALADGGSPATVSGTYGTDPAAIRQVLSTLRPAPAGAADSAQSAPAQPSAGNAARVTAMRGEGTTAPAAAAPQAAPNPTYSSWHGVPKKWPAEIIAPTPPSTSTSTAASSPVGGFDTCSAPSLAAMKTFRSHYAAAGMYIGGANSACAYGNLSASWIQSAADMGYGMLPTYVGRQAPCWNGHGALITVGRAAVQGESAAADAVNDAKAFGLPKGSPIYYDMEAYTGGARCKTAVLNFLGAWVRRVGAGGYLAAVYSSLDSGIVDMQAAAVAKRAGFTPPDAIWIAHWDNSATLNEGTLNWPLSMRAKQYTGNVNMTIKGTTLNIDKDVVGGPLAR
jgi:hypothetical protein